MFSGIVEEIAVVQEMHLNANGGNLVLLSTLDHSRTAIGDSICVSGVCLTVVECRNGTLSFDVANESLRRTSLGGLKKGDKVNLERSLKIGERLHGHFVFGHVDATSEICGISGDGASQCYRLKVPADYRKFLVTKGSVTLSGVALTVCEVTKEDFCVYLVPHTLKQTTLGQLGVGDKVNLEVDMVARYVENLLSDRS